MTIADLLVRDQRWPDVHGPWRTHRTFTAATMMLDEKGFQVDSKMILDIDCPAPQWAPKRDDEIIWHRGKHYGRATYVRPYNFDSAKGHLVNLDASVWGSPTSIWVEYVGAPPKEDAE